MILFITLPGEIIYTIYYFTIIFSLILLNELIGFIKDKSTLYAVVQQSYVAITANTDLEQVKKFLTQNGFENTRNNDYFNPELGIILEDLHDENVLTRNGVLYFIDTVFFLTKKFWLK